MIHCTLLFVNYHFFIAIMQLCFTCDVCFATFVIILQLRNVVATHMLLGQTTYMKCRAYK